MAQKSTIVVSGSFRRFFPEIKETILAFESLGITVLSPYASEVINPNDEFVILKTDETRDPKTLEQNHLDAIRKADALYLCNPEGYLGNSSVMELGWAMALGKTIFCKEPVADATLRLFAGEVATPEQIKDKLLKS